MSRHFFLTGPTGCGKTSLLRLALGPMLSQAGGFVTEAAYGSYGELTGFTLAPAAAAGGVAGFTPETFLDCTHFPPYTDNEVFRRSGVRLLQEAVWYPYAMLDEFGGFELLIPQFRTALYELLRSDLPLIGAVKPAEEAESMRRALGLGEKHGAYVQDLHRYLMQDPDTQLLDLSASGEAAAEALAVWMQENLR